MTERDDFSHSFNVRLTSDIMRQLKKEQDVLAGKFTERRFYDSSPHLSILTKFMGYADTTAYVQTLMDEFRRDSSWELEFSDFRQCATGDYIFLYLAHESRQRLLEMHERALCITRGIGLEEQTPKRFRSFVYEPHISIMKLEPVSVPAALPLLSYNFVGTKMPVIAYDITRHTEDETGFATFPVVCAIELFT